MELLRIDSTDIILQDFGPSQGKIIISNDDYGYNFSYYWGAMGSDIKTFIGHLSSDYFIGKLSNRTKGDFNAEKSTTALRRVIKEHLKWYEHMEFQKEMREKLKEFEDYNEYEFISKIRELEDVFDFYLIKDEHDRKEVRQYFIDMCYEQDVLVYDDPREYVFLAKLLSLLQTEIKKQQKVTEKVNDNY